LLPAATPDPGERVRLALRDRPQQARRMPLASDRLDAIRQERADAAMTVARRHADVSEERAVALSKTSSGVELSKRHEASLGVLTDLQQRVRIARRRLPLAAVLDSPLPHRMKADVAQRHQRLEVLRARAADPHAGDVCLHVRARFALAATRFFGATAS